MNLFRKKNMGTTLQELRAAHSDITEAKAENKPVSYKLDDSERAFFAGIKKQIGDLENVARGAMIMLAVQNGMSTNVSLLQDNSEIVEVRS